MNDMYMYEENNGSNQGDRKNRPKMDVQVVISEGLMDLFEGLDKEIEEKKARNSKVCPKCGRTLRQIEFDMVVGCQVCYATFKMEILKILQEKNLVPSCEREDRNKRQQLQKLLEIAIRTENYEKAEEIKGLLEGKTE